MTDVLIGAALLACPDPENYAPHLRYEAIERYLERLATISELRSTCAFVSFWRDDKLLDVLHEENAYPFRHSLAKAFAALSPNDEFQLEDANVLATALLERSLVFEDEGNIRDIIVADASLAPDVEGEQPPCFKEQLVRALAFALPVLGDGNKLGPNVLVAMSSSDPPKRIASFTIEMVEEADGSYKECLDRKQIEFSSYKDVDSTLTDLSIIDLWGTQRGYADCIALQAARETVKPSDTYLRLRSRLRFGADFLSSAQVLGFLHDPKKVGRLLRAGADLLLDRNLGSSHWLRTGIGGNDPQRKRGVWYAWRHDIDHEFHLHYWRDGPQVELANLVTHNDFSISS